MFPKDDLDVIPRWNQTERLAKEIVLFLACPLEQGVLASSGYLGMWYHIISNPRPPVQAGGEDREKLKGLRDPNSPRYLSLCLRHK